MTEKPPLSRAFAFRTLALVCIAVLCAALWKQRADLRALRADQEQLREQNEALLRELAQNRGPSTVSEPKGATVAPRPTEVSPPAPPPPPPPEPNRLALADTAVKPGQSGLVATMHFRPTKPDPLGVLALVVRLPRDGAARILGLAPVGGTTFAGVSKRVSEDGKFAIFQGTLGDAPDVTFALTVSGPATAEVRGNCGISPFHLEIQPSGATVHRD